MEHHWEPGQNSKAQQQKPCGACRGSELSNVRNMCAILHHCYVVPVGYLCPCANRGSVVDSGRPAVFCSGGTQGRECSAGAHVQTKAGFQLPCQTAAGQQRCPRRHSAEAPLVLPSRPPSRPPKQAQPGQQAHCCGTAWMMYPIGRLTALEQLIRPRVGMSGLQPMLHTILLAYLEHPVQTSSQSMNIC